MMYFILTVGVFLLFLLLTEKLLHFGWPAEVTRKVAHIGGGVLAVALPYFLSFTWALLFGALMILILWRAKNKNQLHSLHPASLSKQGPVLFACGATATAFVFWPSDVVIYQISMLILAFSDAAAGLTGYYVRRYPMNVLEGKSWPGSAAFFLVTLIILLGAIYSGHLTHLSIIEALTLAGVLTVAEAIIKNGWDNVAIPLLAGSLLLVALI